MTVPPVIPTSADEPSIGELAKDASAHLSTIFRGEIELAKAELKTSVKNAGLSAAMFAIAGVLFALSLPFGLIALAEYLAFVGLYRWAAFLIVFGAILLIGGLVAYLAIRKIKKVKSPERTIATAKDTAAYLRHPTTSPS